MIFLYNLLLLLSAPIWVPWHFLRTRGRLEKPNWRERTGRYSLPASQKARVWFHAVSVGEVVASAPILREVRRLLPDHEIVLSVTTSSGHKTAREQPPGLFDHLVYFPIDVRRFQRRALSSVRPRVLAVFETELWLNCLSLARGFGARTLMVNGRISDRSFPRALRLRFFYRSVLSYVDRCLMQSSIDAERIRVLGAEAAEVLGNCKFDQAMEGVGADAALWRQRLCLDASLPVIVVGSTRGAEEEAFVLDALSAAGWDRFQVIHAPRHLERVEALAQQVLERTGRAARRSLGEVGPYLILDTYGELAEVYSVADLVIVGGGFANLGGQNIIQPLAHGKPVLHGTHMQNFRDVAALALRSGASRAAASPSELASLITELLADPAQRAAMGDAARRLVAENVGASRRYAEAIAAEARKV